MAAGQFIKWDIPLLTTNLDRNLDKGLTLHRLKAPHGFADHYPWNAYFSNSPEKGSEPPTAGFGIWYVYKRNGKLLPKPSARPFRIYESGGKGSFLSAQRRQFG